MTRAKAEKERKPGEGRRTRVRATGKSNPEAARLLKSWREDDSGHDEKVWPGLRESLDRDRLSDRKLYGG